jgi:hypothetical protein
LPAPSIALKGIFGLRYLLTRDLKPRITHRQPALDPG